MADIKAANILHAIADEGILESFVNDEMADPSPRKFVNGSPIYVSRPFGLPEDFGTIVLSDFGEVVQGDVKRNHDAQPNVYRSPEVMLKADWSYPIDMWNVGAMVCIFRKHFFKLLTIRRYGMYSSVDIYFTVWTPIQKKATIQPGHILPKSSVFSAHRRWICSNAARGAVNSSQKTVGGLCKSICRKLTRAKANGLPTVPYPQEIA